MVTRMLRSQYQVSVRLKECAEVSTGNRAGRRFLGCRWASAGPKHPGAVRR
jgi:hypothetical protein